jgi:hypothetical protein
MLTKKAGVAVLFCQETFTKKLLPQKKPIIRRLGKWQQ